MAAALASRRVGCLTTPVRLEAGLTPAAAWLAIYTAGALGVELLEVLWEKRMSQTDMGGGMAIAHTRNALGERHELVAHLRGTAELASQFAAVFGAAELGWLLGLWHDMVKFPASSRGGGETRPTPRR